MAEIRLYDSTICRLCAEDNKSGEMLFTDDSEETELSTMINRYLPLKIYDDGKLPRTICPGCNIQLEAAVQFFELLINGQRKIREMWKQQVEFERKHKRQQLNQENIHLTTENSELINAHDESTASELNEQPIFINVMSDGSMYTAEHDLSLQMEGLDKPRKKRGRPPKASSEEELKESEKYEYNEIMSQEEEEEEEEEYDGDGRRRRKRQVPKRYMETVQGKELEKIFKEEGVFDEDEIQVKYKIEEYSNGLSADSNNTDTEIIGHLETVEGNNLGELVVVNKNQIRKKNKMQKSKMKKKHKFVCSYCDKGFLQRSKYIIHKSFHKKTKYECAECQYQFSNKEGLILHQNTIGHIGEKIIEVSNTEKNTKINPTESIEMEFMNTAETSTIVTTTLSDEFDNIDPLIDVNNRTFENNITENHEDAIREEDAIIESGSSELDSVNSFKCDRCNKHFQSKNNLETHIRVVHQGEKPFICEICNKAFAYESSLKGHKEIVHQNNRIDKGFPCDICGKVLNHPSSVIYHKLTEHNTGHLFVCNKCGKSFKHKQLLQRHQLVHSENRPYPCKICQASFKTKANLLNHQSTHTGEKKHFCEICNHKFAHKTSLTLHYRTHTGQKPYKCDICLKSFSQNGNLQEHMRIHTGEKPYCCDHCNRKFTTSSQFKLHVKRHTGERPWKCEFCAKSFLHKDTWKCHVRRHTGERPFQCVECNRGFTEQWALKKHLRLHTGEKPYRCEICEKAFADCSNLTKHRKVHKNQQNNAGPLPVNNAGLLPVNNGDKDVWQILPDIQEENKDPVNNIAQIMTNEVSEDGMSQIIYVTYQDPDNLDGTDNIQFHKENLVTSQESNLSTAEDNEKPVNVEITPEADLQLQITDEDGNAIPLSMQEARQLLSEGQFVSHLNDGQTIRIQGLSTAAGISPNIEIGPMTIKESDESKISPNAETIVKVLEDESTDTTTVETINPMNTGERLELADGQQAIEFITQDGQKVRLVTSLGIDPLQLASEYLTIA